ncbi:MAG: alginate lyase family protein [bacterium]
MVDVTAAWSLLRIFGPKWVLFRTIHACKTRLGVFRRALPVSDWESLPLGRFLKDPASDDPATCLRFHTAHHPPFLFDPVDRSRFAPYFREWNGSDSTPASDSERIRTGEFRYFQHTWTRAGFPPDWHLNPFTRQCAPRDRHWSDIGDFDHGDIKAIWELNRFGFVYPLVRAYWRTGDEGYAEIFWRLVESWMAGNPPQKGANWKCGQEISIRVMAWCFGLYGFLESGATTPDRVSVLARMIACSGERIAAHIDYALSQRNNHAVSEAAGLWTIGVLFPEFRLSEKWERMGREILESQGMRLIYDDGAFAQHSTVYQCLAMQAYLWVLRLGHIHGRPFSDALKGRLAKAASFLYQLQDKESGRTPYYGQNDGSNILPLSNCDPLDFRPIVQAVHYMIKKTRCYPAGPWDEALVWLFGKDALESPVESPERSDLRADTGGYYTLRSNEGFLFTRCASFRHRPAQADLLHADVWWRGLNIALDPGTYSYNAPAPWDNPLARTAFHNTVSVDDLDQMDREGRFLWLPWASGRVLAHQASPVTCLAYWEGGHDGYARLRPPVNHRRGVVRLPADHWLVADSLESTGTHRFRLHWLIQDTPHEWERAAGSLRLRTPAGDYCVRMGTFPAGGACSLVRADRDGPRGWYAPYYFTREPALSIDCTASGDRVLFVTLLGPGDCSCRFEQGAVSVQGTMWAARVLVRIGQAGPIVQRILLTGRVNEVMEIAS